MNDNLFDINSIGKFPTCFRAPTFNTCHESTLRSWHVVDYVERLLRRNTPPETILEILRVIREMPDTEPFDIGNTIK